MGFRQDMWEHSAGPLPAPQWSPYNLNSPPTISVGQQFNLLLRWEGQAPGVAEHYCTAEITGPDGRLIAANFVLGGPNRSAAIALSPGQISGEAFYFTPPAPGQYQVTVELWH